MAPSAEHLHRLVMRNVKLLKAAWKTASHNINARLPTLRQAELQPIPVKASTRQSSRLASYISRCQARSYTTATAARGFSSSSRAGVKFDRATLPTSKTYTAVRNLTGRTPFATALRPNLTGGALPRTAGGYGVGSGRVGGARYFSHGPAAPAQVIQNVSQAVRAFFISGKKAQYCGTDAKTGNPRYKTVTDLQESTSRKISSIPKATPGSYIDFSVNPTITAFTPLSAVAGYSSAKFQCAGDVDCHLNATGLLDVLSADFSRALRDLMCVMNDLKALSSLGDLPITYRSPSTLRVHFPGCDMDTVENLCQELDIKRGIVSQDDDFDAFVGTEIALLFPFAPSQSPTETASLDDGIDAYDPPLRWDDSPLFPPGRMRKANFSTDSNSGVDLFGSAFGTSPAAENDLAWLSSASSHDQDVASTFTRSPRSEQYTSQSPLEYRDFEGLYRFINMCDEARR